MKIKNWVMFEAPGEKEELKQLINSTEDDLEAIGQIAEKFDMDLSDATTVYNIYKERMSHD